MINLTAINTLEDYSVSLGMILISLKTIESIHIAALQCGSLKDEHIERANAIIWDIKRLQVSTHEQLSDVLDLLPDDLKMDKVIDCMKKQQLATAKQTIKANKKPRKKHEICNIPESIR